MCFFCKQKNLFGIVVVRITKPPKDKYLHIYFFKIDALSKRKKKKGCLFRRRMIPVRRKTENRQINQSEINTFNVFRFSSKEMLGKSYGFGKRRWSYYYIYIVNNKKPRDNEQSFWFTPSNVCN